MTESQNVAGEELGEQLLTEVDQKNRECSASGIRDCLDEVLANGDSKTE